MGVFKSNRIFSANPSLIPLVAKDLMTAFQAEGFDVKQNELLAGNAEVSITKGGMFKAVLGLKTALRISLRGDGAQHIVAEAGVGIFGQQVIPTVITLFITWPVLLTQIWGMIKQSHLDDRAMKLIEESIARNQGDVQDLCGDQAASAPRPAGQFCPECGASIGNAKFCPECGTKIG